LAFLAFLVVGAPSGGARADSAPAPVPTPAGDGSCALDDDEEGLVVCGRELVGELGDLSWLVMPRGQCSELLEDLFADQACNFADGDCQRVSPAAPAPAEPIVASSGPPSTLPVRAAAGREPGRAPWPRAQSDLLPDSPVPAVPSPPPRTALA
jgi:hypothetical protein